MSLGYLNSWSRAMSRICLSVVLALLVNYPVFAENWPTWRGPTGQGYSAEKDLPLKWSEKENVRWKVALPDTGNGSPIVWGKRIFLTQATDRGKKRGLTCFDREAGKLLWHKTVAFDGREPTHD